MRERSVLMSTPKLVTVRCATVGLCRFRPTHCLSPDGNRATLRSCPHGHWCSAFHQIIASTRSAVQRNAHEARVLEIEPHRQLRSFELPARQAPRNLDRLIVVPTSTLEQRRSPLPSSSFPSALASLRRHYTEHEIEHISMRQRLYNGCWRLHHLNLSDVPDCLLQDMAVKLSG